MTKSEATRAAILAAGVLCARKGLHTVTARCVERLTGIHHSNVTYHFKGNAALLDAVAAQAVLDSDLLVIARLLIEKHPAVRDMPGVDRDRALLSVASSSA